MDKQSLGRRIREARQIKGLSQRQLAEKAAVGEMYLSEIERGIKMPSMNIFIKLIDALEVSADYVLRDEVPSGEKYICDEMTQKISNLSPREKRTAMDILDAYIRNVSLS